MHGAHLDEVVDADKVVSHIAISVESCTGPAMEAAEACEAYSGHSKKKASSAHLHHKALYTRHRLSEFARKRVKAFSSSNTSRMFFFRIAANVQSVREWQRRQIHAPKDRVNTGCHQVG